MHRFDQSTKTSANKGSITQLPILVLSKWCQISIQQASFSKPCVLTHFEDTCEACMHRNGARLCLLNSLNIILYGMDVTTGKIQVRPLRWWAKSAPHGWGRVKVSENLGATAVVPVAPADTSLYGIPSYPRTSLEMDGTLEHC